MFGFGYDLCSTTVLAQLASLQSAIICVLCGVCPFDHSFFLAYWFSLSSRFKFYFDFDFSTSSCLFILSFSFGYYAVFSVSVATCIAYRVYLTPTCADLFFYS